MKDKDENLDFCNATHKHSYISQRWSNIKRTYGLTKEEYLELLYKQNQRCAICGSKGQKRKGRQRILPGNLEVDHDHKTGKVRELLCMQCNLLLGTSKDNRIILTSAIRYLSRHRT